MKNSKTLSVFIAQAIDMGWIIEKLMQDIASCLKERGVRVSIGDISKYDGEDIVFHSRYLYAQPVNSALINSVFVTHIDDKLKEMEIQREFKKFTSFVCMSPADADLLKGLGCQAQAAIGINLPHRGMVIRPKRIAIFSGRYDDGRKNEDWIIDYLKQLPQELRNGIVLCLIGYNWEKYCIKLADIGASYELYRYDRSVVGEYMLQKEILANTDYLLYPAFDGGAMCVYDGISAGVKLIISDISYHKSLFSGAKTFDTKDGFFSRMDEVLSDYSERLRVSESRSIDVYVDKLLAHWQELLFGKMNDSYVSNNKIYEGGEEDISNVLKFYRSHYKSIDMNRLSSTAYRIIKKIIKEGLNKSPNS